jgi:hypothetical protein
VTVLKLVSGERVVAIVWARGDGKGGEKEEKGRKAGRILEDVMSFIAHDANDPGLYLGFEG